MSELKICSQCQSSKSLNEFYLDRGRPRKNCKQCFYSMQNKNNKLKNQKAYYYSHQKQRLEYNNNYYEKNKEKLIDYQKKYRLKNPEKVAKLKKEWDMRFSSSLSHRLKKALRARVYAALKNKAKKAKKTQELVGCSISELIKFIENKFQKGMTWDNYGLCGWHIDHIRPCAAFNLTDPTQQKLCFHYSNLQPLWAIDNLKKGDSLPC